MRGHWHPHHHLHPHPLGRRGSWRRRMALHHYVRARLHRRLFAWFGLTILLSAVAVSVATQWSQEESGWKQAIPAFVVCLVVWAVSGKIARRLARPLADVARVAHEIGAGKLASRANLECRMPDEVGVLAHAINDMASRIERQLNDQRVLLAAVSHELRTPLGHLRILLELIRTNGADAKTIDELEREVVEIDTLVGELLASSRLDFTAITPKRLDAVDVAKRALDRAGLDGAVLSAPEAEAPIEGDPTLIARALANLIDNAKKHGGGVVALRVIPQEGGAAFEVDDAGQGIAETDTETLFEPFYKGRNGSARSENGTLGLGLSLVKRIAEAHGGTAYAKKRPEGGARVGFEVRPPPPPPSQPPTPAS